MTHWTSGGDGSLDEGGQMNFSRRDARVDLLGAEAMVKRSAKAHFFFLNMGCPSIEIERDHLAIQSVKQFDRAAAGRPRI